MVNLFNVYIIHSLKCPTTNMKTTKNSGYFIPIEMSEYGVKFITCTGDDYDYMWIDDKYIEEEIARGSIKKYDHTSPLYIKLLLSENQDLALEVLKEL